MTMEYAVLFYSSFEKLGVQLNERSANGNWHPSLALAPGAILIERKAPRAEDDFGPLEHSGVVKTPDGKELTVRLFRSRTN